MNRIRIRHATEILMLGIWIQAGQLMVAAEAQPTGSGSEAVPSGDTERATYLGVTTAPVDGTLARHLGLSPHRGLVVQYVDPDSPAAQVLKPDDVLLKLNDQVLINHHQLAVLVRGHRPGEEVTLSLLREAKPVEVKVRLGERDLPRLPPQEGTLPGLRFGPPRFEAWTNFPRIPDWMKRGFFFDFDEDADEPSGRQGPAGRTRIRIRPGGSPSAPPPVTMSTGPRTRSVVSIAEGDRQVTLTESDAGRRLTIADATGKTLFEGPVDNEAQRQQVPAEYRGLLEQVEQLHEGLKRENEPQGGPTGSSPL